MTANSWPGAQVILSFYKVDIEKKGILNKLLFYFLFKVLLFNILILLANLAEKEFHLKN